MKYVNKSFRLPENTSKRLDLACNRIGCFKGAWLCSAVEEKLKQDTDEQIEHMRKEKHE